MSGLQGGPLRRLPFRVFSRGVCVFVLALFLFPAPPSGAVDGEADRVRGAPLPLPLIPVLAASRRGAALWRPDWPLAFPPDAFTPSGAASVTLITEEGEYRYHRDRSGAARDFPFPFPDGFYNVSFTGDAGRYTGFRVSTPGGEALWTVEFLAFQDDDPALPSLCRVFGGGENGVWYFAALEYRGGGASETWYRAAGEAAGVYAYTFAPLSAELFPPLYRAEWTDLAAAPSSGPDGNESAAAEETVPSPVRYFYDSFGMVSGITFPAADYAARFAGGLPRYWNRPVLVPEDASVDTANHVTASQTELPEMASPEMAMRPGIFRFQWDENGLLRRFSGMSVDGDFTLDSRFDCEFDGRGNWTERRETVLARWAGYLVPTGVRIIRRLTGYGEAE